jgi:hypothetical protein
VGDGQPFERYQCAKCGAHNPPRRDYCVVCGAPDLRPVPGPPLFTRRLTDVKDPRRTPPPERR